MCRQVQLVGIVDAKASAAIVKHLSLLVELVTHANGVVFNVGGGLHWNVELKIKNVTLVLVIIELLVHARDHVVLWNDVFSVLDLEH